MLMNRLPLLRYHWWNERSIAAIWLDTSESRPMCEDENGCPVRIGLKKWNERMKFCTNSGIFCLFPHFSGSFYQNLETFHHFLRISVKFWENFIKISRKNDQNSSTKIGMKWNFISFRQKSLTIFNWNFEVLAVRRQRNLVDLEKSWKMRLFSLS